MQARIKNPAVAVPNAMRPLATLGKVVASGPIPPLTRELVHLRVSQINGCAACVDMHVTNAEDRPQRLAAVAVWREAPFFTDAERAALALAEAITRIADETDRAGAKNW